MTKPFYIESPAYYNTNINQSLEIHPATIATTQVQQLPRQRETHTQSFFVRLFVCICTDCVLFTYLGAERILLQGDEVALPCLLHHISHLLPRPLSLSLSLSLSFPSACAKREEQQRARERASESRQTRPCEGPKTQKADNWLV